MKKSNVSINSNVYPVKTTRVVEDWQFRKRVRGKEALRKLYHLIGGPAHDEDCRKNLHKHGITDWQIKFFWDEDVPCSMADGEKTFGLVQQQDGYKLVCRCRKTSCQYFKECRPDYDVPRK